MGSLYEAKDYYNYFATNGYPLRGIMKQVAYALVLGGMKSPYPQRPNDLFSILHNSLCTFTQPDSRQ